MVEVDLEVHLERSAPQHVLLRRFPVVVGRHRECRLQITSRSISRRHFRFTEEKGWLSIEDMGSANGTFVNGERIDAVVMLHPGDLIEIGPVRMVVHYLTPLDRQGPKIQVGSESVSESEHLEHLDNILLLEDSGEMGEDEAPRDTSVVFDAADTAPSGVPDEAINAPAESGSFATDEEPRTIL